MKIILMGYMGSGKSTIALKLSRILGYTFIDLDVYIETLEGLPVKDIFKTKGEIYFRKIETVYLKQVLDDKKSVVIALGGGTPCYGNNMNLILNTKNTNSIYLKASIKSLAERLQPEKHKRPLIAHLQTKEDLTEFVGKHLFERSPYYSMANVSINVDEKSEEKVVETIILNLF